MNLIQEMFKHRLFGVISFVILCLPLTAWAGEGEFYATAGGGFLFYTGGIDEKTDLDYAADFEFSLGRYLANNFTQELVIGYLHDGHESNDLRFYSLSLTAMRMFPVRSHINLFLGGGFFGSIYSKFQGYIDGIETRDYAFQPGISLLTGIQIESESGVFARFQLSHRLIRKLQFEDETLNPNDLSTIIKFGYQF